MPLEEDLSTSGGDEAVVFDAGASPDISASGEPFTGCNVLLPELPGDEEEVMAVTSASRPSLTTLTESMSLRCRKSR